MKLKMEIYKYVSYSWTNCSTKLADIFLANPWISRGLNKLKNINFFQDENFSQIVVTKYFLQTVNAAGCNWYFVPSILPSILLPSTTIHRCYTFCTVVSQTSSFAANPVLTIYYWWTEKMVIFNFQKHMFFLEFAETLYKYTLPYTLPLAQVFKGSVYLIYNVLSLKKGTTIHGNSL